jgi:hypothetical protein
MATTIDQTTTGSTPRAFEPSMRERVGTATTTPGWDMATERRIDDGETLARQIGWFSIALGVTELVAAEPLARWLGMRGSENVFRLYGLREIGQGIGVLSQRRPEGWMWVRIAGDVLDLATLAPGLSRRNRKRHRVLGAMLAVAGVTALDVLCVQQLRTTDSTRR